MEKLTCEEYRFEIPGHVKGNVIARPRKDAKMIIENRNGNYFVNKFYSPEIEAVYIETIIDLRNALNDMIAKYEELQHDLPTTPAR